MRYAQSFTYFVRKPRGGVNLLCGCVCVLIPVVGQMVLFGYQAEMAEDLDRDPDLAEYPDFDFNRFVEYLKRGVWPFVVQLVAFVTVLATLLVAVAVGWFVGLQLYQELIGLLVGLLVALPLMVTVLALVWPLELYTQLNRRPSFVGAVRFTARFVRLVGGQLVVSLIANVLIGYPVMFVGMLSCLVGVYPATVVMVMAQQHFMVQLYRLYLQEGGAPIGGADALRGTFDEKDESESDEEL